jgi:peptidoglycan hydrolase-like protein with peptidoglycan-binding domain
MKNSRGLKTQGSRVFASIILVIFFLQMGITGLFAGDLVRKAQETLIERGINPGPVDGLWGPMTKGAVKKFQEKEGLSVSGRLDDATKIRLFSSKQEAPAVEKMAPVQTTQETTKSEVPLVPEEKILPVAEPEPVKQVLPKLTVPAPTPVPVETKPVSRPEPKAKKTSGAKKASGPCPQPRKTKSAPANIARLDKTGGANSENGKKIYNKTAKPMACKMCHGDKGDGKGKLGAALKPNPRNFTCAETMQGVSAGQMFWIIKNGSPRTGMAAHKKSLKDKEIWDVVKYIRSTFSGETPSAEKTASKPVTEATPVKVQTPSVPKVTAPFTSISDPGGPLPKGFKATGKYKEGTVSNGGAISGVIKFSGNVPLPIMEDLSKGKNVEFCSTHPDAKGNIRPRVKVATANGNLKDTVVFIQNIETGKAWPAAVNNFDFQACDIFPKVSVIRKTPKGMKTGLLTITNQDPDILHNPHGYSIAGASRKTLFNKPLPSKGDVADVTRSFKRFKASKDKHFFLQCDQHNFMEADARVVWNPYYSVSGADGAFKIDQVPAGKYWVTAWHPYIGEVSKEVTVTGGADARTDFELLH